MKPAKTRKTGADQSLGTQRRASQRRLYAQGVVMGVNQNIRKRQHPETSALKNANHHPRICEPNGHKASLAILND